MKKDLKNILILKNKSILSNEKISNLKIADSYLSKLKGLMLKKDIDYVLLMVINKSNFSLFSAVHTLFMKFTIDVLFLDESKKIFEIATLSPWKYYKPKKSAIFILEGRSGFIEKHDIAIGDSFDFICE